MIQVTSLRPSGFWLLASGFWLLAASCGRPAFKVPAGPGAPAPEASAAWSDATARCRGAETFSAALRLSGRVGSTRLPRGTILAGLTSRGQIRLEAPAPFGRAAFVLAGTEPEATLVMRDNHVLVAPADRILEALVGVTLDPASLLTVLAGCGLDEPTVEDGARFGELIAVRTVHGRAFLREVADHWRVVAVERSGLLVDYARDPGRSEVWPRQLRLTSAPGRSPALALSIAQSQIEVNVPLPAGAFTVEAPASAVPLTLEQLRASGPLGEGR